MIDIRKLCEQPRVSIQAMWGSIPFPNYFRAPPDREKSYSEVWQEMRQAGEPIFCGMPINIEPPKDAPVNERALPPVDIFAGRPQMYCIKTDQMRLVTQKDVDDMQRVVAAYGRISSVVKQRSAEVQAEQSCE